MHERKSQEEIKQKLEGINGIIRGVRKDGWKSGKKDAWIAD